MADANKPNWIGVTGLVLDAAQLRSLAAVEELNRKSYELQADQQRAATREAQMRQVVFDLDAALEQVRSLISEYPRGAMIALTIAREALEKNGIVPSAFSRFDDKDRLKLTLEKLNARADEARASAEAKGEDPMECVRYLRDLVKLERLISRLKAFSPTQQAERRRATISRLTADIEKSKQRGSSMVGTFITVVVLGVLLGALCNSETFGIPFWIGCGVATVVIAFPDAKSLLTGATVAKLQAEVAEYEQKLSLPPTTPEQEFAPEFAHFGVNNLEQSEALWEFRARRLKEVIPGAESELARWHRALQPS